jgi:hypothetical protein
MNQSKEMFGLEFEFSCSNPSEETKRISDLINSIGIPSVFKEWHYTDAQKLWVCKPDASCGIEVCTPVLERGRWGDVERVLEALSKDPIEFDESCSVHVHVDFDSPDNSWSSERLCSLLSWWVKFEHIFVDFAVPWRKVNKYCKCIGETFLFDHDEKVSLPRAFSKLSDKYLTMNTFHMFNRRRSSVEFRLLEATKDFSLVEKWVKIIHSFVDSCKKNAPPENYTWADPEDFFSFVSMDDDLKVWMLERLISNSPKKPSFFASENSSASEYFRIKSLRDFG